MLIAAKTRRLKDGASITIRVGREDDAAAVLALTGACVRQNDGLVWEPDEYQKTKEEVRAWISAMLRNDTELFLLAEHDGKIVGNIDFHIGPRARLRHTGSFGMSVAPEHRGRGVGRALLGSVIEWAHATPQIERIELSVISNNSAAIALYKKFGFEEEGRRPRHFKYRDGSYAADVIMGLRLT
jgi:RimJ/RimL family protein N-acetyltransferase